MMGAILKTWARMDHRQGQPLSLGCCWEGGISTSRPQMAPRKHLQWFAKCAIMWGPSPNMLITSCKSWMCSWTRKQDKARGYSSKTFSCFSTSLQRFLEYALKHMRQSSSSEKREALEDLRDVPRNSREAWGKTIAQQQAEVEWEAEKNLPTTEEIRNILSSEHVQKLWKIIMHPRRHQLTTEDAVAVGNYLVFLINMENASRAGPVAEITLDTFKNGRMVDDKWTIHIAKQKTTKTTGGLILNFSSDLKLMICSFIDHFRPLLARNGNFNTDTMFLNCTGSPFTNSHVHHALKQFAARTCCLREESLGAFCSSMLLHFVVKNTRGWAHQKRTT